MVTVSTFVRYAHIFNVQLIVCLLYHEKLSCYFQKRFENFQFRRYIVDMYKGVPAIPSRQDYVLYNWRDFCVGSPEGFAT